MTEKWKRWSRAVLCAALAAPLGGCVAFNVGQPKVQSEVKTVMEEDRVAVRTEITKVGVAHQAPTYKDIRIGLSGDFREEYHRKSHTVTTSTLEQKRLAFGLFPGAAEEFSLPPGAEKHSCLKPDYPTAFVLGALPAGLFIGLGTVHSLVFELPFGSFDCWKKPPREGYSHLGLVGFHKYTAVISRGPERGADKEEPPVFKARTRVAANGPYHVEFSVPGLVYSARTNIEAGATGVSFPLPIVQQDYEVEAFVTFRKIPGRAPADLPSRALLAKTDGKTHRFTLFLHPPPKPPPQPKPQPEAKPALPPVVLPKSRPQPPEGSTPAKRAFEVVAIQPHPDGQYEVRVRINDRQQTLTIGYEIIADIKRIVHDSYMDGHPLAREEYVSETVRWSTEEEGHILVYRAWAFSVQPVTDSWRYSSATRRGSVSLRLSGGMGAEEAKRWARENISSIVADKNVLIRAGEAPPPGATYRTLDEEYRNGVLTVEFSAEE